MNLISKETRMQREPEVEEAQSKGRQPHRRALVLEFPEPGLNPYAGWIPTLSLHSWASVSNGT